MFLISPALEFWLMQFSLPIFRGCSLAAVLFVCIPAGIRADDVADQASGKSRESTIGAPVHWELTPTFVGDRLIHLALPMPLGEDRPLELELNVGEPLDLSDLVLSLTELPELSRKSKPTSKDIALASNDEPIQIGGKTEQKVEAGAAVVPANPLRSTRKSAEPTKDKEAVPVTPEKVPEKAPEKSESTSEPSSPPEPIQIGGDAAPKVEAETPKKDAELSSKADIDSEPMPLMIDEEATLEVSKLPTSANNETSKPAEKSTRPKMRKIEIDPISDDEQESPSLSKAAPDSKAKDSHEEDKAALDANKPIANEKTFVGRSSRGKLGDQPSSKELNVDSKIRLDRVEKCLAYYLTHLETTAERSPWSVMHAMLPFGVEGEILVGNRRTNAIQWLSNNGTCRGQKLFTPTARFFRPNVGGGVQGHEGQFLAMLAQSQVAAEYPIVVGKNRFTVADLVRYEMATCRERTELTFKLMGLSYYVDTSQVWTTDRRSRWNIEKLVKEELAQPVNGAACGGTHRLMGLTFAIRQRQAEGRPIDGQFARADKYIHDFVEYTWKLQNPDGSFSTNWFESRGNEPKMERKVQTTGHMLEWLAFTIPEDELHSAKFTKSIDFLLSQIYDHRENKWPIGPRGHAIRALALFQQRTTGVLPGQRREVMADQIQAMRMTR